MSNNERRTDGSASGIEQAAAKLASYRKWVAAHSRGGRLLILLGTLTFLLVLGWSVESLQATIGVLPTRIVAWIVLLVVLYTWYALGRGVVADMRA